MANVFGFAGLGCCAAAFLFSILALALPYWVTVDTDVVEVNSGLWRSCTTVTITSSDEQCEDTIDALDSDSDKAALRGTRAMVLLGFFCITGAMVCVVLLLFVMKDKKILGFIGGGVAIAGGFFLMIGMAIYAGELKSDSTDYSAGFAFDILGWLVSWIAGGLICFAAIKGDGGVSSS